MTKYLIEEDERYPDRYLGRESDDGEEVTEAEEAFIRYATDAYEYAQSILRAKTRPLHPLERRDGREQYAKLDAPTPPIRPEPTLFLEAGDHSG